MCSHLKGLSMKKNVAVHAAKDYSGNMWEGSSVGGTHPITGNHGKRQTLYVLCGTLWHCSYQLAYHDVNRYH